jgi:hypothetical protein
MRSGDQTPNFKPPPLRTCRRIDRSTDNPLPACRLPPTAYRRPPAIPDHRPQSSVLNLASQVAALTRRVRTRGWRSAESARRNVTGGFRGPKLSLRPENGGEIHSRDSAAMDCSGDSRRKTVSLEGGMRNARTGQWSRGPVLTPRFHRVSACSETTFARI